MGVQGGSHPFVEVGCSPWTSPTLARCPGVPGRERSQPLHSRPRARPDPGSSTPQTCRRQYPARKVGSQRVSPAMPCPSAVSRDALLLSSLGLGCHCGTVMARTHRLPACPNFSYLHPRVGRELQSGANAWLSEQWVPDWRKRRCPTARTKHGYLVNVLALQTAPRWPTQPRERSHPMLQVVCGSAATAFWWTSSTFSRSSGRRQPQQREQRPTMY